MRRDGRSSGERAKVAVVLGTRPEAIKLAPVIQGLKTDPQLDVVVIATGQHRQMLDQVLSVFRIEPDYDLNLMVPDQTLPSLTSRVIEKMSELLSSVQPDVLIVQGDTTTAFATALSAFYSRIPVAHVEAGLRSFDVNNPYPEEMNRKLVSALADIHFAPTPLARDRLLMENIPADRIVVTGNTVVDALTSFLATTAEETAIVRDLPPDHRIILVTSHRRESWGRDLDEICFAIREIVTLHPDVEVIYPVHMNPRVRRSAEAILTGVERIHLIEPLDYLNFVRLMKQSYLILTDSGGVQEEAPTLSRPLLLMRKITERPEAFEAGVARIVGTSRDRIVAEVSLLLDDHEGYRSMQKKQNPYGDGNAAGRIVQSLVNWKDGRDILLDEEFQFNPAEQVTVA